MTHSKNSFLLPAVLSASILLLVGCASGSGSSGGSPTPPTASVSITAVSPTDVPVGSSDLTLTVNGTGFANGATVSVNKVAEATTFISSSEIQATVPAAQLKVGAVLSVEVSSGSSVVDADPKSVALSVDNPVPAVSSISPAAVLLGAGDTTVTVTGTDFVPGVVLSVNGTPRTSTFVSDTQFTAQLSATDFTSASSLPLNVINPKPGGGTSGTRSFAVDNPAPAINSLSPSSAPVGSGNTTVTLTGSGLLSSTVVQVNGATRAATFISGTQMSFVLSATDLASAAGLAIAASNPLPGGGASASSSFNVTNPGPTIAAITPSTLFTGGDATTVVVNGSGFVKSSALQINGAAHPSAYVSATEIDVPLSGADLTSSGTLSIVVNNAQPGGGASAAASIAVNNPVPAITSLSPSLLGVGSGNPTVTIAGTGFLPTTTLQINGSAHAVTYSSSRQMSVALTATELAQGNNFNLILANGTPGGGSSTAATVNVTSAAPVITAISPSSAAQGSAGTTVTITGSNFVPASTVQVYGATRSGAAYISSTQMSVFLTADDLSYSGSLSLTVTNPGGIGISSGAATFTVLAATPILSTLTPSTLALNSGDYSIVATGPNFSYNSVLLWNGTPLATSYTQQYVYNNGNYTPTYTLTGTVPQNLLTTIGTVNVTVSTPTATAASNALAVSITNPPVPAITSLSQSAVPTNADAAITLSGTGFAKSSVVSYNGTALTTTFNNNTSLGVTIPASMLAIRGNGSLAVSTPAPGGGTSAATSLTTYFPVVSNNMVFNPINHLAYLAIPSTGSSVTGNSIVSFDPETGALGQPVFVGSEPDAMAISDDGTTLWVALDGTSAVREVNLLTGVAGMQYSVAALDSDYFASNVTALLLLPGTTDSVAVAYGGTLGIYDAGVLRASTVTVNTAYALQADGSRSELYAGTMYNLQTYTYNSSGLTLKVSGTSNYNNYFASSSLGEMQLSGGKVFTDFGGVYDSESGGLLGTFMNGTNTATGPTLYDAALSQVYVLTNPNGNSYTTSTQVELFSPTDYSNTNKLFSWTIPYYITDANNNSLFLSPHRLTRWGANGLLLHTRYAMFTAQSNIVKDESAVSADLSVSMTSAGGTTTGSTATYTAIVKNSGPQPASDVALAVQAPATGIITSATSSNGSCQSFTGCDLGTLAANASVTVTVKVLQTTSGAGILSATTLGSSTDPNNSNNTATSSITVTGDTFNLVPGLASISPDSVKAGSSDTTITVTGSNFVANAVVLLGSTSLTTTFVNATQLTAVVPSADLTSLGWSAISVSAPTPGGGVSNAMPFSVFNVVTVGINHIVYEPYTRQLLASVSSGSSSVTGSSIVSIDPSTGVFGTPIPFATAPTTLALSTSGKTLYSALTVPSNSSVTLSIARVDVVHGTSENTSISFPYGYYFASPAQSVAIQPGTEDVIATPADNSSLTLYDYDESANTLTARPQQGGGNAGCFTFLDANNLLNTNYSTVDYPVTANGLSAGTALPFPSECVVVSGNTAVGSSGDFYKISSTTSSRIGTVIVPSTIYGGGLPALDLSVGSVYFAGNTSSSLYNSLDGIVSYDAQTFLKTGSIFLNIPTIEGSSYPGINDIVRWGQDGLALVTSTGHLYLLRGPFVVPGELGANTAATLTSSSSTTITAGSDNTLLTLAGSNFLPGVAVTWNGSYRTTTVVDASHVTVAIPAADVAAAGTGKLVATNPGAPNSNALTVTVQ